MHAWRAISRAQRGSPFWFDLLILIGTLIMATAVRWGLDGALQNHLPYVTFFIAVAIIAWLTTTPLAVASLVLGWLLADYFFVPPRFTLTLFSGDAQYAVGTVTYFAVAGTSVIIAHAMRQAHERAEQALRAGEARFHVMADAAPAMLWITTPDGQLEFISRGWLEYTGQSESEVFGPDGFGWLQVVHEDDREQAGRIFLDANRRHESFALDYRLRRSDGQFRWAIDAGRPRFDEAGNFLGFVGSVIDVHERKMAEQDLNRAQALAHVGSWRLDVRRNELWWSDESYRIAGISKGTPLTYESFLSIIHPDDREYVDRKWKAALRGEPYDIEHRIVVGGEIRWAREQAQLEFDARGELLGGFGAFHDITDRLEAEQALEHARQAAEEANRIKDEFLATLSHELRTPLTPALAGLLMLENSTELSPAVHEDLSMIRRNLELEARLIDDLLDLTRIVKGKIKLELEVLDVHEVLRSVMQMFVAEAREKSIDLRADFSAADHHVQGDSGRLQQAFCNLIKNALKFTPESGRIEVRTINDRPGELRLIVQDNGIGMSSRTLAQLFTPFAQAEGMTRLHGGLGLGLAITRSLLDVQGGTIEAQSDGIGCGARFMVTLPLVAAPGDHKTTPSRLAAASANGEGRGLRLLLVEDHTDTARAVARLLRSSGHEVSLADSVESALAALSREMFDVLVSDLGLPDGTGIDLLREVRRRHGPRPPAIALTGYGMEQDVERCRQAGFDRHLTKPINIQQLTESIQEIGRRG